MPADDHALLAMTLIETRKTMVLATCCNDRPWTAPVYYVYMRPDFCFFSSPRSRHIADLRDGGKVAASIFADSDQWEAIEGLQMTGQVTEIRRRPAQLNATARYLVKFPFTRDFLSGGGKKIAAGRDRVRLYGFTPRQMHYVNNRLGFGHRVSITPPVPHRR